MKYLLILITFLLLNTPLFSQSVTVTPMDGHAGNSASTYPLMQGVVTETQNSLAIRDTQLEDPLSWSVSLKGNKVAVLSGNRDLELATIDYRGNLLTRAELEFFDLSDRSLKVYQFDDGRTVVRDNIVNFTFLDAKARPLFSVSNSSGSPDGERISELSVDQTGSTVILYNPVIAFGERRGSQARLVFGEEDHEVFYRDENREISQLKVSRNGAFISIVAAAPNGESRVLVFDRFGNELEQFEFDETVVGSVISENGRYLTAYFGNRVQVYDLLSGDRLGSASSRTSIIYAEYQPEDDLIVMIGGSAANRQISGPIVTAVHLTQRQIASADIEQTLSISDPAKIVMRRTAANSYRLEGLNKHLRIETRF